MPVDIGKAQTSLNLFLMLGILGVIVYIFYKVSQSFTGPADNGQPRCSTSDMTGGTCVSGDGKSACGWWEFFTATSCYKGNPSPPSAAAAALTQAQQNSSVWGGIAATVTGGSGSIGTPATPGLPVGYDPVTGTVDGGV